MYKTAMAGPGTRSYRDLIVWQRSIQMCVAVYGLTRDFPREEAYGSTNQLRRAGVSVPSNIAEGYGRLSRGQYRQFLGIAQGSNFELQTQLVIARALRMGDPARMEEVEGLSGEVGRMLTKILRQLPAGEPAYR